MTDKEALKLEAGQEVRHKRYGKCFVKEVMMSFGELFGVVIRPSTEKGRNLLMLDSKTDILNFLEDSAGLISVT